MNIKLKSVRLAFPELHEAKPFQGQGEAKFSATFIIPPETKPLVKNAEGEWVDGDWDTVLEGIAKEKWGEKWKGIYTKMIEDKKCCFLRGPKKDASGNVYDGFDGAWHITSRGGVKPTLLDMDGKTVLDAKSGKPYGGCYVNVILDLWPQDNEFGKRINSSPTGVQFVKHGDAFAGGTAASPDDFEAVDGTDADDLG